MIELVDSHAHLDFEDYGADRTSLIDRFRAAGVGKVVLVGLWRRDGDFGNAHDLSREHPDLFAPTAGVHPHDCARVNKADWARLEELAKDPLTRAVGETGLDYHYDHSPREDQRKHFERQLELARAVDKPVVVHTREADEDTVAILKASGVSRGVIHCFTGGPDVVERYLELGFLISVAGVVTFKTADALREAVSKVPLDRLMVETDCPFLTPVPHRGRRNEPAYVRLVAEKVAEVKGVPVEELAAATTANARAFFGL